MAILASKGIVGTIKRATLLPLRYGMTSERILARLLSMEALLQRWDAVPTVPVTAIVLERRPELARSLNGSDIAVHGYRHIAYADLSAKQQAEDLDSAMQVFIRHGLAVHGFRAPYLRADRTTQSLLAKRGFLFDSSGTQHVLPRSHPAFPGAQQLVSKRYGQQALASGPHLSSTGLVELPVSLPDDVILVDGLGITRSSTLWRVFEAMLGEIRASRSLLVVQVHPERFHLLREAVELALKRATEDSAWKASLSEIAHWVRRGEAPQNWPNGSPYAISVTGDLDAVSIGDFVARFMGE